MITKTYNDDKDIFVNQTVGTEEPSKRPQKFELTGFEACHQDAEISEKEYQICHGKSTFLKPEKVAKMQREHTGAGWAWIFMIP